MFGAVDYVSYGNIQQGESLKVIFPASGTVIAPRPMMILKTSQHPGEAKAFIDYVLSPAARRPNVTGAEGAAHHQRGQQRTLLARFAAT